VTIFSADIYLTQSNDIAARTLGDDTIIMSTLDSIIFMLNGTGTLIWNAADGKTPFSAIVQLIAAEFEVTAEQARDDAEQFVKELAEHKILLISNSPVFQVPNESY
jgi:hypothetical protein